MFLAIGLFFTGIICGILLEKFILKKLKISIQFQEDKSFPSKKSIIHKRKSVDSKFNKAQQLINEIREKGHLPFTIRPQVMASLDIIAKTQNWEDKIDDDTLNILNKIYDKWQNYLKSAQVETIQSIVETVNMEQPKYWEGTEEEYFNALEQGIIDENTEVNILFDEKIIMEVG